MSAHAGGESLWRRKCLYVVLLGAFFFLTYGGANYLASQREDIGSVVFGWELHIPFWDWSIVPYWSIDLFYPLSLLICSTQRELNAHALRLLTAQVIAVICFIAWPLKFAFARPEVSGPFGWMFEALHHMDQPFNLAPSLHIVLLVVLWDRFAVHIRSRAGRMLLHAWFALIGISVLTAYQHHFLDIPTGVLVGLLCIWLWPVDRDAPWRGAQMTRDSKRWRLAGMYGVGALLLTMAAALLGSWALWLLWPAVSLLMVALNYLYFGADGFQKKASGNLSLAVRLLLWPYLAAVRLNAWLWTRDKPSAQHVMDGVSIGRAPRQGEASEWDRIVDVSAELSLPQANVTAVPMLDLVSPGQPQLRQAVEAIEKARQQGSVLVCCALGYSRSALAVGAWLLQTDRAANAEAAVEKIREARPEIIVDASQLGQLA